MNLKSFFHCFMVDILAYNYNMNMTCLACSILMTQYCQQLLKGEGGFFFIYFFLIFFELFAFDDLYLFSSLLYSVLPIFVRTVCFVFYFFRWFTEIIKSQFKI